MKKIISAVLCFIMVVSMIGCTKNDSLHLRLERTDWAVDVKTAINDLLDIYGVDSANYSENSYAVFDFDNTSSIFDIEDQLCIYQLQSMAFAVKPEELSDVLFTNLSDSDKDLSEYGLIKGTYEDIIGDIVSAYTFLWKAYGPFTPEGLSEEDQNHIQSDPQWLEFATKLRLLYELVDAVESSSIAYPWVLFWFTGMTEDEVYNLAKKSHEKYSLLETSEITWTSPDSIESRIGSVSYTWTSGFGVTENIKELWKCLDDNGIDVWVCSASCTGAVRAAIDVLGLHEYCTGMLAMTVETDEDGKHINKYDYDNGFGYYAKDDETWEMMSVPEKAQPFCEGKVTAITNAIAPEYSNQGPIACFMDSTGDFNFCTEFKSTKLVCCFNRANRKVTDGGGLIAETAIYQRDTLGYNLKSANDAGDTFYVLQGRDENGMRSFRNSNLTLRYGETEEKLFADESNQIQLDYIIEKNLTTAEIFSMFAVKSSAEESPIYIDTGFLDEYAGYHSHD